MGDQKPKFNPDQPYEKVEDEQVLPQAKPKFDPNAHFEVVGDSPMVVPAHTPEHQSAIDDAGKFIGDYINSHKAASAINKLTEDNHANDFYQTLINSGAGKKDATRVAVPIPRRLPKEIETSGNEFVQKAAANPEEWRKVLTVAKRQNPEDAPKIDAAMYVTDASKRAHVPGAVSYYADQMKQGKMMYDLNKKQIIKPAGALDAFFNGMKQHSDAMDKYDFLTSHNDKEIIDYLNKEGASDPDKPVLKATNAIPSILETQGANASAMAKMAGPGMILSPYGATAAAFGAAIGAGAGAQDFHHTAYANTLSERYHELVNKGADPQAALAKAKEDANMAGMLSAGQGIALSAGGALGKELEIKPVRYSKANLNALADVGSNIKTLAKYAAPEIATQAGIAGVIKSINNSQQGKVGGELDEAGAMALFTAGMIGLKVPGAFKGGKITPAGRTNLLDLYAKTPEPIVDAALQNAVKHEALTPTQAGELKVEINTHKASTEGKPDLTSTVTPEAEDFIQKHEEGQLSHIKTPTEAIMKIAKQNGIEEPKEGEAKLSVEDIYNKLKHRQSSGRVETIEAPDLISKLPAHIKAMHDQDPEGFMKFIADQAHEGTMLDGKYVSSRPATEKQFGKELVDAAVAKYPEHSFNEPAPEKPRHTVSTPNITNVKLKEDAQNISGNQEPAIKEGGATEGGQNISGENLQLDAQQAPKSAETAPEEGGMIGVTHATTDEFADRVGLDAYEKATPQTHEQWLRQAQERITKDPQAIPKLVNKLKEGDTPSAVEQKMMGVYLSDLDAKILKSEGNPSNELLAKAKEAKLLSDVAGGREVGRSLEARKGAVKPEETILDFYADKMNAANKEELTTEEKKSVAQSFKDISESKKDLADASAKIEEKRAEEAAGEAVEKIKKTIPKKPKKTADEFKKERDAIWADLKNKWDESKGQLSATIIPYADRLVKIAPEIAKLARSHIEEGAGKLSDVVKALHDQIKGVIPEITEKDIHDIIAEEGRLKSTTKKTEKSVGELADQLNEGKFIPKEKRKSIWEDKDLQKKYPDLYKEALEAKDRLIEADRQWQNEIARDEYNKMSKKDKFFDKAEQVLGIRRALSTAFDFSIPFRQGLRITLDPTKIGTTAPAFKTMFEHTTNPKAFDRWLFDLQNSPDYKNMLDDGLTISDPHELRLSKREEQFRYNLANEVPGFKASQRAASTWLNYVRVDLYRKWAHQLELQGFTRDKNPEKFEAVGKLLNNLTGRGHLPESLEKIERPLGAAFFGPRLAASKINLLNPVYYAKMPKEVRTMALKNLLGAASTYATVAMLLKANGFTVETDPTATDFLKLKHGDTRYDLTGGEAVVFRTAWRILHAAYGRIKSSASGDEDKIKASKKEVDKAATSTMSFFRNKLAPNTAYGLDAFMGKNSVGQPFDPTDVMKVYPMWISDIQDDWKQDKANSILYTAVPSIFGVGVQTYTAKDDKDKEKSKTKQPRKYQ